MDSLAIPQDFSVEDNGHMVVKAAGETARAAFPEGSDSVAVRLARVMAGAPFLAEKGKICFRFPNQGFADYYGEGMGIGFEDGLSGRSTLAGGTVRTERERLVQDSNIRCSTTVDVEALARQMSAVAGTYGRTLAQGRDNSPYAIDPESPVVGELTSLCCQVLGVEAEACFVDGGTYVRRLPNTVAFGPGIQGQKKPYPPSHDGDQPDKCMKIENLTSAMEIYIEALKRLDVLIGG